MSEFVYKCLTVSRPSQFVVHVSLNRPNQRNALSDQLWRDIHDVFKFLANDSNCRCIVLSGNGKAFCAGIDLKDTAMNLTAFQHGEDDPARRAHVIRKKVLEYQRYFVAIEECTKPVIAAIHGACIGGGLDLITFCDIRFASRDAYFSIREVNIGMVADVGTLNRLPRIVGSDSWLRELAITARDFDAHEALQQGRMENTRLETEIHSGLVSRVFENQEDVLRGALETARLVATKSPIAVQGTKVVLNYSRDHSVADSQFFTAVWNQSQLLTEDVQKSALAAMSKSEVPQYSKL